MNDTLTAQQYRELIEQTIGTDADSAPPTTRTLYTPPGHRAALDPNASVVLGGRGVGKTTWFHALLDDDMRAIAADHYQMPVLQRTRVSMGFGSQNRPAQYPGQRTLAMLLERNHEPLDIWYAVALHSFGSEKIASLGSWEERVAWVKNNPETFELELAYLDAQAHSGSEIKLMLFDALDLLHRDRSKADELALGILQLALELRMQTRHLRAKIFVRPDLWESVNTNFTDASKLFTNLVDLGWEPASLYSLLFHLMSNNESATAEEFRIAASWTPRKDGSEAELKHALGLLASEFMGKNHRKGRTYTWIPNHLADGRGQTSPRSILAAIQRAAMETKIQHPDSTKALHWDGIRTGVQHASETRVKEIREDIPWVGETLDVLRKKISVPVEQAEVERLWDEADIGNTFAIRAEVIDEEQNDAPFTPTGPSGSSYSTLVQDLKNLGIFTQRTDGRLDLPDVYRLAFDIGRKGGVPLARKA